MDKFQKKIVSVICNHALFSVLSAHNDMMVQSVVWLRVVRFGTSYVNLKWPHILSTIFKTETSSCIQVNTVFPSSKENNSKRERKRNYSSWQTTLADRKHECCQELGLILSSKIQVEAGIPQPAPVVSINKPLCLNTFTGLLTFSSSCKTITVFPIILKCIGSTKRWMICAVWQSAHFWYI